MRHHATLALVGHRVGLPRIGLAVRLDLSLFRAAPTTFLLILLLVRHVSSVGLVDRAYAHKTVQCCKSSLDAKFPEGSPRTTPPAAHRSVGRGSERTGRRRGGRRGRGTGC